MVIDYGKITGYLPNPEFLGSKQAFYHGVVELLKASQQAIDVDVDVWEFAVDIDTLLHLGLTKSDLRWMTFKSFVQHAHEVTRPTELFRTFDRSRQTSFSARSCFTITTQFAQSLLSDSTPTSAEYARRKTAPLAESLGCKPGSSGSSEDLQLSPEWDPRQRLLSVCGFTVKHFQLPAKNQELVLSAFQEEGWPTQGIFDPLPQECAKVPRQRLRDTIRCLNRNQKFSMNGSPLEGKCFIRFRGDGSGEKVTWSMTNEVLRALAGQRQQAV